jgi:hypothetical protein
MGGVQGDGEMMYLLPTGSDNMRGVSFDRFGVIRTPGGGMAWGIRNGYQWAADNQAFTQGFDPDVFFPWLATMEPWHDTCLFVPVYDRVGSAVWTLIQFYTWRAAFHGWPLAFVAQDGQEDLPFPPAHQWDWLFIGGTDKFKLGRAADICIRRAQDLGKHIHVGRVNSQERFDHFSLLGVDSVDGTHWIYEPDKAKVRIDRWTRQKPLFYLD